MRTLDATFQAAMDSGHFTPIVRAAILDPDDHSVVQYLDLKYFKINGLDIDVEFYDPSGSFTDKISLERGVKVAETEYTIFSGEYYLTSSYKVIGGATGLYKCSGSLIEPAGVNLAGDGTYHAVIDSVLALGDCTATWKHPAAAWLSYQFLADGAFFHTSNIYTFFTLLKQKYLIHATENGIESILFFDVASVLAGAPAYTLTLNDRDTWSSFANYRQFVWRDEADTVHTDGPAGYPIHNLGYLESTTSPPVIPDYKMPIGETLLTVIPNLKYQTGDLVTFDSNITGVGDVNMVLDVTEIFDARDNRALKPTWRMELRPLYFFANTEGGHIESSSQYTTPYVPLATSGFHGLLDSSVNNLQALADAVDGLAMGGSGTAGRIAQFSGAHGLTNSNLVGPAANVLTLEATGAYTLTVPATGTAALLGTANVFSSMQTISIAGGGNAIPLELLSPGGGSAFLFVGKALSNNNIGYMKYVHQGDGFSNNYLSWGFYGADNLVTLNTTGLLSANAIGVESPVTVGNNIIFQMMANGLNAGASIFMQFGKVGGSNYNSSFISYHYVGDGSTSNYLAFDFYGVNNTLNIVATDRVGVGTYSPTAKLQVTGSADIQQLLVTGHTTQAVGTAMVQFTRNDTAAGISSMLRLTALGGGAAADGGSIAFAGKSSTTADQVMGNLKWSWNVATHASAVADVTLEAGYHNGAAIVGKEFIRGRGGATPLVGLNSTLAGTGFSYDLLNVKGSQLFVGQDSTSETPIFEIVPAYIDNTHSDYTTRTIFNGIDANGTYELMRFDVAGEPKIGFFGHAAAAQPAAYTPSNVSADRSYNANATTTEELADVLGTLIADLQTMGLVL